MPRLFFILPFILAAAVSTQSVPAAVSARLKTLAARARTPAGWRALRQYARSAQNKEARGLAYFTLGYQEYLRGKNGDAASNLKLSASTGCLLADFAEYYESLADENLNRFEDGIAALDGLAERRPESAFRLRVINQLANLLIKGGHPQRALDLLQTESATQTHPSLLLLAAKANEALQNDLAAAENNQEIYNSFPYTPEARQAETALGALRERMGSRFPQPSDETQTRRVKNLFQHGFFQQALNGYDTLLLSSPRSPLTGEWRIGRAQCFLQMRQYPQAIQALSQKERGNPELDAERLGLEVRAYELSGDEPSMLKALDEIYHKYPRSPYYGDALAFAGGYFAREGFWQTAARYYAPLAQNFPENAFVTEASWRVAWYDVLAGNTEAAQEALIEFLKHYPNSSLVPAALYWLAVVEGQRGSSDLAQKIYRVLAQRYPNTYYGLKARQRFSQTESTAEAGAILSPSEALASFGITIPPRPPLSFVPCSTSEPDEILRPYYTLVELGLNNLAEQYLQDAISDHPGDPQPSLALARSRALNHDPSGALFAARLLVPDYQAYRFEALPAEVWRLLYPRAFWPLVRRYAERDRLDPYLVIGLIRQESAFNPRATSSARARGLMQIEPYTATMHVRGRWRRRRITNSLYSPAYNIRAGCLYLHDLLRAFNYNVPEALAAYNAGDFRVLQWIANSKIQDPDEFIETIPFTDTRAYVEMVLRDSMIYHMILTGEAKFERCPRRLADLQ